LWFEVLWDKTPISTNKMDIVENTCHPSYVVSIIRKISVLTSPDKNMKPYLKKGWGSGSRVQAPAPIKKRVTTHKKRRYL
jgi:hypothetical protein